MKNNRTAVYSHFDANGDVLYIGASPHPFKRFDEHAALSPWAGRVTTMSIEWYASRCEALAAERDAIASQKPPYNREWCNRKKQSPIQRKSVAANRSVAGRIIKKCGGPAKTAELIGRTESWVYRWTYPKSKGGTGGEVPRSAQKKLLDLAHHGVVEITPHDFF